jgi:DNA-binding NtrC family response regulator
MASDQESRYRRSYYVPQEEKTHDITDALLPSQPRKVLILEDDESLTKVLEESLGTINCSVTAVTNGVEGIRAIMAEDFDAIVCDMVMPKLAGDMFYLAVERARPHLCKRFVFMTGYRAEKRLDEFARSKGCLILFKPFELGVFLETVQAILNKAKPQP